MPLFLAILRRRHWQHYRYLIRQIDIRLTLLRAGIYLTSVFALHSWIMVTVEGLDVGDAIWLTLTTVVTVGYGDFAATTLFGRIATVILIYLGGIFVLFHIAADYFEYRTERKLAMLKGRWRWNMDRHILVLNAPTINRDRYILGLVDELRRTEHWCDCPIQILTRDYPDGLPEEFQEAGVVHFHGDATNPDDLAAADADKASIMLVLAENAEDKRSDEITFDILHRLKEIGAHGRTIAECVRWGNRTRLRRAGADSVMRPIRFYPEIVVRAINSPGSEMVLENLFMGEGDECRGFEVRIPSTAWSTIAITLMQEGLGTAIGYTDKNQGTVYCNPAPDEIVTPALIFMVVKQDRHVRTREIQAALKNLPSAKVTAPAGKATAHQQV